MSFIQDFTLSQQGALLLGCCDGGEMIGPQNLVRQIALFIFGFLCRWNQLIRMWIKLIFGLKD